MRTFPRNIILSSLLKAMSVMRREERCFSSYSSGMLELPLGLQSDRNADRPRKAAGDWPLPVFLPYYRLYKHL